MKQQLAQTAKAQIVMCAEAIIALRSGEVAPQFSVDTECSHWAAGAFKLSQRLVATR